MCISPAHMHLPCSPKAPPPPFEASGGQVSSERPRPDSPLVWAPIGTRKGWEQAPRLGPPRAPPG